GEVGAKTMSGQSQSIQCSPRTDAQWVFPEHHQMVWGSVYRFCGFKQEGQWPCCVWSQLSWERLAWTTLTKFSAVPDIQGLSPCLPIICFIPTLTGE
ncbi:mCG1038792, partial [Mus musculus]